MGRLPATPAPPATVPDTAEPARLGSQTLFRGLDVLEVVAEGPIALADLAVRLGLTRSTTHRLASSLVDRRYLTFAPRAGYGLGPKLLELGFRVRDELDPPRIAAPHLQRLALLTEDTVHLGVLEAGRVLYLDKVSGKRRVNISSRIGESQPVTSTALGKAILLDEDEETWTRYFRAELGNQRTPKTLKELSVWLARMRTYARLGYAFDLEENEDQIRCIAAPIRDVAGKIVAAISVSSAAQYMGDERMQSLARNVVETARRISAELGWRDKASRAGDAAAARLALSASRRRTTLRKTRRQEPKSSAKTKGR